MMKEGRSTEFVRVQPKQKLVLRGKTQEFSVVLHTLKLTYDDAGPLCLEGDLSLSWETYQSCLEEEAFGLKGASRGESLRDFEEGEVMMQVFLRQDLVLRCFSTSERFDEEILRVLEALQKEGDYLQKDEAWVFLAVLQTAGQMFDQGYRNTSYKDGSHLLR